MPVLSDVNSVNSHAIIDKSKHTLLRKNNKHIYLALLYFVFQELPGPEQQNIPLSMIVSASVYIVFEPISEPKIVGKSMLKVTCKVASEKARPR